MKFREIITAYSRVMMDVLTAQAALDIDRVSVLCKELRGLVVAAENRDLWRLAGEIEQTVETLDYWVWTGGDPA